MNTRRTFKVACDSRGLFSMTLLSPAIGGVLLPPLAGVLTAPPKAGVEYLYERRALEALGLHIELANDTDEALQKLARKHYDLVISDMGRTSSTQAGYDLLRAVRDSGADVPFVIYAGSNSPEHRAEAKRRGAQGTTNDPSELFELVLDHILT